ncbi:hypothetical protein ACNIU7_28955, partial [Escherichia coli]
GEWGRKFKSGEKQKKKRKSGWGARKIYHGGWVGIMFTNNKNHKTFLRNPHFKQNPTTKIKKQEPNKLKPKKK